jgi:hypothetical protein
MSQRQAMNPMSGFWAERSRRRLDAQPQRPNKPPLGRPAIVVGGNDLGAAVYHSKRNGLVALVLWAPNTNLEPLVFTVAQFKEALKLNG